MKIIVGILIILAGAACALADGNGDGRAHGIIYLDAERILSLEFIGNLNKGHAIDPLHHLPGQRSFDDSDIGGTDWEDVTADCSTPKVRCIVRDSMYPVIAVPTGRLSSTWSDIVANNQLKVIKCLRGNGDICQIALLQSECYLGADASANTTKCHPSPGAGRSLRVGYFIYNEDFGITSLSWPWRGGLEPVPQTFAEILTAAEEFHLVGDMGLLKGDIGR